MKVLWTAVSCSILLVLGMISQAQAVEVKELYKIETKATTLKQGQSGKAGFHIVLLKKGTKVHPQAPFHCSVSASKGLKVGKHKLGHKDKTISKDMKKVAVQVTVTGRSQGKKNVKMDCSFFVCTKDICARTTEVIKVATTVK